MIDINKYSIDATKFKTLQPENKIEWRTGSAVDVNSWVMRITADRRIEVNEDVEVTEAAKKVLDAMQHLLTPQRTAAEGEDTRKTWVGLTDDEIEMTWLKHHDAEGYLRNPNQEGWAYEKDLMAKLKEKNT
jgi:hypothetical protein